MSCLSFLVPRAVGPLHPPVIQMLGGNEFRLRQGFRLWRKRLYAAKAEPARRPVVWCFYTFSRFQNIDFNRPFHKKGHDLRRVLFCGFRGLKANSAPSGLKYSGWQSCPRPRESRTVMSKFHSAWKECPFPESADGRATHSCPRVSRNSCLMAVSSWSKPASSLSIMDLHVALCSFHMSHDPVRCDGMGCSYVADMVLHLLFCSNSRQYQAIAESG